VRNTVFRLYKKRGVELDGEAREELRGAAPILKEEGLALEFEVEGCSEPYPEGLERVIPHTWERYVRPGLIAVYSFTGFGDDEECDPTPWADVMLGELRQGYHYDPCGEVPVVRVPVGADPAEAAAELEKAQAAWKRFEDWVREEAEPWPEAPAGA